MYYCNRFEEGAAQFRRDVALNPSDTEEAIWTFLCEARLAGGFEGARRALLIMPQQDRRTYMRVAYELFAGRSTEEDLAAVRSPFSPRKWMLSDFASRPLA